MSQITSAVHVARQTALVTGGTFGIGLATATELAQQGLTVVITGRDATRAETALATIKRESGNSHVSYLLADFFQPTEVRGLARDFLAQHDKLNILVNNAGGTFAERKLTADGFERTWALNHLAYMQITLALLPVLKASAPARIVNVASGIYSKKLDFDNLQGERSYNTGGAYIRSKLANLLFTYTLARHLSGMGVTVNAVNPGIIDTGLSRDAKGINGFINWLLTPVKKTPEQGAFPSVYMATSPEVEETTGKFFDKNKFVVTAPVTHDIALQEQLWEVSMKQLEGTQTSVEKALA